MPRRTRICSITEAEADRFARDAKEKKTLWCENLTGLHLIKLKRGGSWRYRYKGDSGRWRTFTIGKLPAISPEEAATLVKSWKDAETDPFLAKEKNKQQKELDIKLSQSRTLKNYLDGRYEEIVSTWKKDNATVELGRIRNHFGFLLTRDMSSLSGPLDIRPWQDQMKKEGRADSTIRRTFRALKTLLNRAVKDQVLEANPLAQYDLDHPSQEQQKRMAANSEERLRRPLTNQEIGALFQALRDFEEEIRARRRSSRSHGKPHLQDLDELHFSHWFAPFFYTALYTGMRGGDLYALNWREIDLKRQRLKKVTEKSKHRLRRGQNPVEIELHLPPQLSDALEKWNSQKDGRTSGLVFPNPTTGKAMTANPHNAHWKKIRAAAGLPDHIAFYSLRHNWISRLVADGRPLLVIAKMAGHTSVEMIERHYGHLIPKSADMALAALADSMPAPREV